MSCVFCDKIANNDNIEEWNTLGVFHFEPLNPVTPGHRIFIVREHVEEARLSSGITGLLFTAATQYAQKHDEDFNLIVNSGPAASQTVRHLHIHYVPRRKDDGLNLPWTGQQKGQFGGYLGGTSPKIVINESLPGAPMNYVADQLGRIATSNPGGIWHDSFRVISMPIGNGHQE